MNDYEKLQARVLAKARCCRAVARVNRNEAARYDVDTRTWHYYTGRAEVYESEARILYRMAGAEIPADLLLPEPGPEAFMDAFVRPTNGREWSRAGIDDDAMHFHVDEVNLPHSWLSDHTRSNTP